MYIAKLRSNILLDGDVELARCELEHYFESVEPIIKLKSFEEHGIPKVNVRKSKPYGYICTNPTYTQSEIIRRLNFIQELWSTNFHLTCKNLKAFPHKVNCKSTLFVPQMMIAETIQHTLNGNTTKDTVASIVDALMCSDSAENNCMAAINRHKTSTQHVHGLHKYKAKFFPRMIRSLMLRYIDKVPQNPNGEKVILDPFVGSGTTLVEASLMGYPSIGIDLDDLSCKISQTKIEVLHLPENDANNIEEHVINLIQNAENIADGTYKFPQIIAKKFDRWGNNDERVQYEKEIGSWQKAIKKVKNGLLKDLFWICLSDALCKKFNIRMMGTGSGRFALEIAKTPLKKTMIGNLSQLPKIVSSIRFLKNAYKIAPAQADVLIGDARKMKIPSENISLIITSPPYLPASSGRENYVAGKAISITALGLMNEKQLNACEQESIGAMRDKGLNENGILPAEVYKLVNWLKNDSLREIKAAPVLNYYEAIHSALAETYRVLVKGGIAVYIIGKESKFYEFKTRKILYNVQCDKIFTDIAQAIGFNIIEQIDIQLDKQNRNARSRSLDDYFESAIVLQRPA